MSMLARNLPEIETWAQVQQVTPAAYADEPMLRAIVDDLLQQGLRAAAQQGFLPAERPGRRVAMHVAFAKWVHDVEGEHDCFADGKTRCCFFPATNLDDATIVNLAVEIPVRADTPIYDAVLAEQRAAKEEDLLGLLAMHLFDRVAADVRASPAQLEQAARRIQHGRPDAAVVVFPVRPSSIDEQVATALKRKRGPDGKFLPRDPK